MGYRLLADAAMLLHFAFLVYVVLGGFLAWRWPWTFVPHFVAAVWGGLLLVTTVTCPLTAVENWARHGAGERGLPRTGFIDYYIQGVVYPDRYAWLVRILVIAIVVFSWVGAFMRYRSRRRRRAVTSGTRRA